TIRVNVENYPPSIRSIDDIFTKMQTPKVTTIHIYDSSGDSLTLTVSSNNEDVLYNDDEHIKIADAGTRYHFTIEESPEIIPLSLLPSNLTGTAQIYVTVTDASGINDTTSFVLTVEGQPEYYQFTGRIPDTGQAKCYDNENEIPCPESGEDFYGQDANYNINPQSFTKLDALGNDLPDSATEWVMVRDNISGLIWEVKTDDGSIHDKDNTYTWYDSNPETNGGNAGTDGDGTDTENFIEALNDSKFGGFSDWRLPTLKELAKIVSYKKYYSTINISFFPQIMPAFYWSNTSLAHDSLVAWGVSFGNQNGRCNDLGKDSPYYVRAVRGGQFRPLENSANLFVNNDETVTDSFTGLMWQKEATTIAMTWQNAIAYCENLSLSDFSDWRLPTAHELRSIVDYTKSYPAIDKNFFNNNKSSFYWSSTSLSIHSARGVAFPVGEDFFTNKTSSYHVRAVRGGQCRSFGHILIRSPEQSSKWNIGDKMPIIWDTQNISGNVTISISREGGKISTYIPIAESTPNDGDFEWTVTQPSSVNCMLKIEPVNEPDKGTTQGLFSIINTPPVAHNESFEINNHQVQTGQLQATDDNSDHLTYTIISHPEKGVVNITNISTGDYTYTPYLNQTGQDSFEFKVNDGFNDSNIATVSIFITAVPPPPQAYTQTLNTTENIPLNITLTGFSPDNIPLTFHIIDPPSHGILSQSTPYLTYTPDHHFYGTDNFTFIANDGISDSNPETVSITIEPAKLKINAISSQEIYLSQSEHITLTGTG
ncbi:MAG: hypothetical protein OMM_11699, partial [Candidatus Magnetoglobus multicellularis str. Araruama]